MAADLQIRGGVRSEPGARAWHGVVTMEAILSRGPFIALTLALLPLPSGCAGLGQTPAFAFGRGDLAATLEVPLERALHAARAAVTQLQFTPAGERTDALQALVVARNASGRRVEIRLESDGDRVTRLRIRVGAFGDEAVAVATNVKLTANL